MAKDMYGDADTAEASPNTSTESAEPKDTESKTALIDSAICPGMEPGDEMVVKIEKVMDKEYLVSYAPEPESEEKSTTEEAPTEEAPASPAPSMASMME